MLALLAFLSTFAAAAPVEVGLKEVLRLEREVGAIHGKTIHCLLGYNSCFLYLRDLSKRELPRDLQSSIVILPPHQKSFPLKDVTILTPSKLMSFPGTSIQLEPKKVAPPAWAQLLESDQKLYDKLWEDGELNITLFLGHKDLGVGDNPNLFVYGVYTQIHDRMQRFSMQWMLQTTRVDEIEVIKEVRLGPDRLVRFRLIDPHLFCDDEKKKIARIEREEIERDKATGLITRFMGDSVFQRNLKCARQTEASIEAKHRLFQKLADAKQDMVFYSGHSRNGRGPDFGSYSSKAGSVSPKELISSSVASHASVIFFNGCSGGKNYGSFIEQATGSGKTVIWNEAAPDMIDGMDDLLLFTQSIFEGRALSAVERYMNLTQVEGTWPNKVRISLPKK